MLRRKFLLFCFLFLFLPFGVKAKFFQDVSKSYPYAKSIENLAEQKVIGGYEDGTFLPGKVINRAEFLKIAIGAKQKKEELLLASTISEEKKELQHCFRDVSSEWFAESVCLAKNAVWVQGYPDGSFQPAAYITFAEAMAMLGRIFELDVSQFESEHWYYPYQRYFEIFDLVPNIQQSLDFQVNRGEMSELVYRIIQHLEKYSAEEIKEIIAEQKPLEEFRLQVFNLVNAERKKTGKEPLVYNIQLEKTAQMHADDMIKRDFFAHVNPDGVDVLLRVKTYHYDQRDVGENIAFAQNSPIEVMDSWMNSPPHRENLLKANFTEMGVGIAKNSKGDLSWVQVFGKQCSERDNIVGCISRAEFQERNAGEWESPYKWYD